MELSETQIKFCIGSKILQSNDCFNVAKTIFYEKNGEEKHYAFLYLKLFLSIREQIKYKICCAILFVDNNFLQLIEDAG